MIPAIAGHPTSAFAEDAPPSLIGILGVTLVDAAGVTVVAHTTSGLTAVSTGATWDYEWAFTAPATVGFYRVVWDHGAVVFDELVDVAAAAPVDQQAAKTQLSHMTAATLEPVLSDDDLNALLALAAIPDHVGLIVTDVGWVPTYDLNYAAAEGWRWKAAKAASSYAFVMDGDNPTASWLHVRCKNMADAYSRKIVTSVPVSTGRFVPPIVPLI